MLSEERSDFARTQTTVLRYERYRDGESTIVDRPWVLHWYTRSGFESLAAAAGLIAVSALETPGASDLQFRLQAAG